MTRPTQAVDGQWRRRASAATLGVVVATGVILTGGGPASAHAGLLSASPGPGIGVPQPPGAVVLRFSEPLNLQLSRIQVQDRTGRDGGQGSALAVPGDPRAMQRKLGFLRPGDYLVRWTSVSTLDGHALHGSYDFGVGVSATGNQTVGATPLASEGPLGLAGRFVLLAGLTLWAGWALVCTRAARAGTRPAVLRSVALGAPGAVAVGAAMVALSSALAATGSLLDLPGVFTSRSGAWRGLLLFASTTGAVLAWTRRARATGAARAAAVVAVLAEAAAGHAASSVLPAVAIPVLAVHLAAVGAWLFAILAALTATRLTSALAALSPLAVASAVAAALTGAANAALELSGPGQLIGTGYGQTIIVKAEVLAVMAGIGLLHLRSRRHGHRGPRLRRPLTGEAAVAVIGLAAATLLAGFPNPPREAVAGERLAGLDPQLATLSHQDAMSLAAPSGPFVVGVTLIPPRPGPVRIRLQVVGVDPGDGLRDASLRTTAPGQPAAVAGLRPCGLGCFAGTSTIPAAGDWTLAARVTSNRGPLDATVTAPLPAPPGQDALARALAAMNQLTSAALAERLRSEVDAAPVVADYRFRAPDTFAYTVNGTQRVTVGDRTYERDQPGGPWTADQGGDFTWPGGYFSAFWGPGVAARLVGHDHLDDGTDTDIVAFVRPEVPAWFRVWVDRSDGLVHREEMRAEGHLMDHQWTSFDQSVDIPTTP